MANEVNFAAIPQTAIRVITAPAAFFREMPKAGGFVEPLIFALVLGCLAGIIRALLIMAMYSSTSIMMVLTSIILMPIVIGIGCFIGAAILFVIWKLMGSQESFETAFRCAAYITAILPIMAVIGVIPYIGVGLGMLLSLSYVVMASVEVQGIPAKKAWIVFGSIMFLLCLLVVSAEYAIKRAARNMEMTNKTLQNYLDESSKALQQKTEMMRKQGQQTPQSEEQMQKQLLQQKAAGR
jgi:hypothetical protein